MDYDPDKDIKAYLTLFTRVDGEDHRVVYRGVKLADQDGLQGSIADSRASEDIKRQRRAVWKGEFPAQKAMTYDLLSKPDVGEGRNWTNYLSCNFKRKESEPASCLRYFHFPANNMEVSRAEPNLEITLCAVSDDAVIIVG